MLFVLCGEKAAWQGVKLHLRLIVNILDIEAGEEGFGQRKDDVEQIGTGQQRNGLSGGHDLMITRLYPCNHAIKRRAKAKKL